MKGAISLVFGVFIIIVVTAISIVGAKVQHSFISNITGSDIVIYDTVHVVEKLKRTVDADTVWVAESALPELAASGCGFDVWTVSRPNEDELKKKLVEEIKENLKINIDELDERAVSWKEPTLSVSISDTGFAINGSFPFDVRSVLTNPSVVISSKGGFESTIETSYFSLAAEARKLAGRCADMDLTLTQLNSFTCKIANMSTDTQLLYDISITDSAEPLELRFRLDCTG